MTRSEWEKGRGAANRRRLKRLVAGGPPPGLIAYVGGAPAGWCAVAPRADYARFERSRVLKPIDDAPVWSITCFFVARAHRRSGLTSRLIEAAVAFAKERGARIVEGYPTDPGSRNVPDLYAWTGFPSAFLQAGFTEVARRSPTRPIVRRVLTRR